MKKVACLALILLVVAALVGILVWQIDKVGEQDEEDPTNSMSQEEYRKYLLNEMFPTEFVVVGSEMTFDSSVSVRSVEEITEESIAIREGYRHCIIVVNDVDGTTEVSEETYRMIWELLNKDTRYYFIYLGTRQLKYLTELGNHYNVIFSESDVALAYVQEDNRVLTVLGAWDNLTYEEYPESLVWFFGGHIEKRYKN